MAVSVFTHSNFRPLVLIQLQGRVEVAQHPFTGPEEIQVAISSAVMYNLSLGNIDTTDNAKAPATILFEWLGDGSCSGAAICPALGGNVCGDFGLTLSKPWPQTRVCQRARNYAFTLESGESLSVGLWFEAGSFVLFQCYLYCTEDGTLPLIPKGTKIEDDVIAEVVSYLIIMQIVNMLQLWFYPHFRHSLHQSWFKSRRPRAALKRPFHPLLSIT